MRIMDIHIVWRLQSLIQVSVVREITQNRRLHRIEKTEENLPATKEDSKPNILFLQLESFFDPTLVNYLNISEDPIPNFRKLMKELQLPDIIRCRL